MAYVGAGHQRRPQRPEAPRDADQRVQGGLPKLKAAGYPNAICFFGKRNGMSDYDGIKNSIACLKQIKPIAEDNGVTVCIELLNSKVNHPDYIGDNTPTGPPSSPRSIRPTSSCSTTFTTCRSWRAMSSRRSAYKDQIGHYHTGGVPGRNELDATQELNWPAVTRGDHRHRLQGPLRA